MSKKIKKIEDRSTVQSRGTLTTEQFLWLLHQNSDNFDSQLHEYINRIFHPDYHSYCPPLELLGRINVECSRCVECYLKSIEQIKEYKNHYKIGRKKWEKTDVNTNKGELFTEDFFESRSVKYGKTKRTKNA